MLIKFKGRLNQLFIKNYLGLDDAVTYTLLSRGGQLIAGVINVTFIAHFLSATQQGFYYTFISILGLQLFFELGLSYVILQFASHEQANLVWTLEGTLDGNATSKARLSSLIKLSIKWYSIGAILFFCIVLPIGFLFFYFSSESVIVSFWKLPWIWLVLSTSISILFSPIFAVLEGCGLVTEVSKSRIKQDLIAYPVYWFFLILGAGLFSQPIFQSVRLFVGFIWLKNNYTNFFKDIISINSNSEKINWRIEIWPMQWKIAVSWLSGYFITQLYNPFIFMYVGVEAAGKMGMSLTIVSALSTVSMTWIYTKIPIFGRLIANREFVKLDDLFYSTLKKSFSVSLIGGGAIWFVFAFLKSINSPLAERIIDLGSFGLLILSTPIISITVSEAIYLRAHKKEPFFWISIMQAAITVLTMYTLGKYMGVRGIVIGNFGAVLLVLVLGTILFLKKRHSWHSDNFAIKSGM